MRCAEDDKATRKGATTGLLGEVKAVEAKIAVDVVRIDEGDLVDDVKDEVEKGEQEDCVDFEVGREHFRDGSK